MKNHKESLATGTGCHSVATVRDGFPAVRKGYCTPSAEIIDISSEGVLCASNKDLINEDWV